MSAQNQTAKIVVVGATGNVGRKIVELLLQRNIVTPENLELLASRKSAGSKLQYGHLELPIKCADDFPFGDANIYLFATESDISKIFIEKITSEKAVVIDSSSLLRLEKNVPLIVAPVNREKINIKICRRYALANCIASPAALVLSPLHQAYGITSVHITTYQSVSGAGKDAMDELYWDSKAIIEGTPFKRSQFPRQIAFNVIPQIGKFMEDGFTQEEFKIMKEIQKIVDAEFAVCATSVRVPVYIGHSSILTVTFNEECSIADIKKTLQSASGVKIGDNEFATPAEIAGTDDVYAGRIRRDPAVKNGICMWICSDNLRRGAALDAVEAVEEVIRQL